MSSNGSMVRGTRPPVRSTIERVESLEGGLALLRTQISTATQNIFKALNSHREMLEAMADLLGADAVRKKVEENFIRDVEAQADQEQQQIELAIKEGGLRPVEFATSPDTLLVVQERNQDGTPRYPTRTQLTLASYVGPLTDALATAKVGDTLAIPDDDKGAGRTLTILAAYEVVPPPIDIPTVTSLPDEAAEAPQS